MGRETKTTNTITGTSTATLKGKFPGKKISAGQNQETDATEGDSFSLEKLSPAEREQAQNIASAGIALAMKGLLNRIDPQKYPVSSDPASPEARAAELAKELHPATVARLRPRLESAVTDSAKLSRVLGKLQKIDLRKADLSADFASLSIKPMVKKQQPEAVVAQAGATFNRLHLVLRKLHCVDETNPEGGTDDMVLGGVLIGASGNVKVPKAFVAGEFDDGDVQDFGELFFGQYSLNTTSGYPKSFYCIFKLVESDSDDKEVAEQLTSTLSFIANIIVTAFAGALVGQTVGAVMTAIGGFFSNLIDEDEFPPYGIHLQMKNQNHFGGPQSGKLHTGNIRAHGGTYRIGYKWVLNA